MVPIILLAYLFNGIYVNLQAGMYIAEKTKYFPVVTGAGALVNVAANLLLIPRLGIIGAALATLASYMVMAAVLHHFAQKYYPIAYEYGKLAKMLGIVFLTGATYYALLFRGGVQPWQRVALLGAFVAALFAMRIVKKEDLGKLRAMLSKRKPTSDHS